MQGFRRAHPADRGQGAREDAQGAALARLSASGLLSITAALAAVFVLAGPARAQAFAWQQNCADERLGPDLAIDYCTRAIASGEFSAATLAKLHHNRAAAWQRKNAFEQELADLNEALRLDPALAPAYLHRGRAWLLRKQARRAIEDFSAALRLAPAQMTKAGAHLERGTAYLHRQEYDAAIADFSAAIEADHHNPRAFFNRGYAWGEKRDYARAIADYTEAIRQAPEESRGYFNRGEIYRRQGDAQRAAADFAEARRLRAEKR